MITEGGDRQTGIAAILAAIAAIAANPARNKADAATKVAANPARSRVNAARVAAALLDYEDNDEHEEPQIPFVLTPALEYNHTSCCQIQISGYLSCEVFRSCNQR